MGGNLTNITLLFFLFSIYATTNIHATRETLEIIIGGGYDAPPPESTDSPPPSPCPPPPPSEYPFESKRLELVYPVIQAFKEKVTYDPNGVTKTWVGHRICQDYKGFFCDTVPDFNQKALSGVKFNGLNLYGPDLTLAGFLDALPDIAFFHANSNNFTGSIPAGISTLRYLYELDLSNNNLNGNFPNEVLRATKLVFLDIRFNQFSGLIPQQVFRLDLDLLFINNNNFAQTLPKNLGSTPVLYLTLANNGFTGQIPRTIGQASKTLREVLFLNNQLSGCLPCEIGLLKKTTVFDVGSNRLTGPIPYSFGCLKKMELMNLARNSFYGEIPESVCSLPKLSNLTVSDNYFTRVGPRCRKLIKNGVLNVKMNCILDLPGQRPPFDCARFFSHPRSCPDGPKLFTYVPCLKGHSSTDYVESSASASRAPTYAALSPHY